ncbi:flagellar export chaperone FliS [Butyrivibrio sp. WCE2006]|jgi:flagellar protein FliS|uniref:flagellar export chaperone FliS n=1 Tax=Butyrivibrio sp. WCE2006 TaxID=1410611 RepID=UPI000A73263A|nr:flagellar export chaperone FliS [Butyrivibrio sp. WCE2006]
MPVARNPYAKQMNQYQNTRIQQAKPEELTLMLYEGAIKFCNIAIMGLENNDERKFTTYLLKVENIIDYLNNTLDMKYPVAKDFENVYNYLMKRLVEADLHREESMEIMNEVNKHIHTMRDTWVEACKIAKGQAPAPKPVPAGA